MILMYHSQNLLLHVNLVYLINVIYVFNICWIYIDFSATNVSHIYCANKCPICVQQVLEHLNVRHMLDMDKLAKLMYLCLLYLWNQDLPHNHSVLEKVKNKRDFGIKSIVAT